MRDIHEEPGRGEKTGRRLTLDACVLRRTERASGPVAVAEKTERYVSKKRLRVSSVFAFCQLL